MEPFLKWAGGKRWLTSKIDTLIPVDFEYNGYFEPFLGSGAMFFHLRPQDGFLSDLNPELINAYLIIRDNWADLQEILLKYDRNHNMEFYYEIRETKPKSPLMKAARFIYLNRTCWNGLYRVNLRGKFNVPIGTKTRVLLDTDNFQEASNLLNLMDINACDFEVTIDKADQGDFVFIDPPYTVKHNLNGFLKYNEKIFSWEDQIRLRKSISKAIDRGARILILNADHRSIKDLYKGIGTMSSLKRASVIAGKSDARGTFNELAIRCW
jgi:DNA adenine methylase